MNNISPANPWSKKYEKFYSKLRILGILGCSVYSFIITAVGLTSLIVILRQYFASPPAFLPDFADPSLIKTILITFTLSSSLWYLFFRRFTKDAFLSFKTAFLICITVPLDFILTLSINLIPTPGNEGLEELMTMEFFCYLILCLSRAIPMIAFAILIKLAADLKNELDYTV